jgi:carboxymethylenebutenolidase
MTVVSRVPLTVGARTHEAVLAVPERPAGPGIVVLHDLTGLRPDTERHCRRFADEGFAAIAPDLYAGGQLRCVARTVFALASGGDAPLPVVEAARAHLATVPGVREAQIAITGFCMGGGFALLAAADGSYAVAAPFYGAVPKARDRLAKVCPTIAQYGELDRVFAAEPERLRGHLEALGVPHEVRVHEGVGHSFMNDHGDPPWLRHTPMHVRYDASAEAVAWDAMMRFLREHLPAEASP